MWIFNDPAMASVSALVNPVMVFCNPSGAWAVWLAAWPTVSPAVLATAPTASVGADPEPCPDPADLSPETDPDLGDLSPDTVPFLRPPYAVSSPDFSGSFSGSWVLDESN